MVEIIGGSHNFTILQSKPDNTCFLSPSLALLTHKLAVKQPSKSSKALTGSVPYVEVPLIPNIATERLPGPDREKEGVKKKRDQIG